MFLPAYNYFLLIFDTIIISNFNNKNLEPTLYHGFQEFGIYEHPNKAKM